MQFKENAVKLRPGKIFKKIKKTLKKWLTNPLVGDILSFAGARKGNNRAAGGREFSLTEP